MIVIGVDVYVVLSSAGGFIGVATSIDDALKLANDDNGGYVDHVREIYVNPDERDEMPTLFYRNYVGDSEPAYFVYKQFVRFHDST